MDWTFRLRDRRLRRWVAYGGRRFAYPLHSASLPRSLRSRLAMPSRAPQARISPSAWRNPPPPHSAPLYKTLTNPNSVYPARHQNLWSLFSNGGFQYGVPLPSTSIYIWGLSHKVFGLLTDLYCTCILLPTWRVLLDPFYFFLLGNTSYLSFPKFSRQFFNIIS